MLTADEANQDLERRGERLRLRIGCGRFNAAIWTLIEGDLREMRGSKSEDIRPAHMRGWSLRRPRFLVQAVSGGTQEHCAKSSFSEATHEMPKAARASVQRDACKHCGLAVGYARLPT